MSRHHRLADDLSNRSRISKLIRHGALDIAALLCLYKRIVHDYSQLVLWPNSEVRHLYNQHQPVTEGTGEHAELR